MKLASDQHMHAPTEKSIRKNNSQLQCEHSTVGVLYVLS